MRPISLSLAPWFSWVLMSHAPEKTGAKTSIKNMESDLFSHFLDLIFLTQGFFRGHLPISLSLTPCFSWVEKWPRQREPFQRFPPAVKTVETVPTSSGAPSTQLKQGVNEPCPRKDRRKDFNQKHGVKKMKTDLFSHFLDLIFLTQGFFLGHLPISLSLTPCFSWV